MGLVSLAEPGPCPPSLPPRVNSTCSQACLGPAQLNNGSYQSLTQQPAYQAALCPCPWRRWHSPFLAGGDPLGPEHCAQCGPTSAGFPMDGRRARERWSGPLQGVLFPLLGVALLLLQRRKTEPKRALPKM